MGGASGTAAITSGRRGPRLTPRDPFAKLARFAITRSRASKRATVLALDAALCAATCVLSIFLRLGFLPERDTPYLLMIGVANALSLPIFVALGLYREIFSRAGMRAVVRIGWACALYSIPFAAVFTVIRVSGVPRTLTLIQPILLFVAVAGSRVFARSWLFEASSERRSPRRRVMIYGAGSAGRQLAGAIAQSFEMQVVGYFDDSPALIGSVLDGVRIHAPGQMVRTLERLCADEILLAIPSAPKLRRKEIIGRARQANVRIRTLPDLVEIAHGRVDVRQVRDIAVDDLLGREAVQPDPELMGRYIRGKTVMVTGAGGSIGGELCRQLLALEPAVLLLVELSEFSLYEIHRDLVARQGSRPAATEIVPLLAAVQDEARMEEIVGLWRPDAIYHAAAYKHVPLIEHNPAEGVRTNVLGTWTLANVAARWRVADFVLVSTDKAVRPANVMGASKRIAEMALQALNEVCPATRFCMVRFGNVLGSSGSVVPLFRQQIRDGGPVTVTDRRITRYFMTAPEAAQLVLQASAMAEGGEVFVLDMGQPLPILELARNMIELAGLMVRGPETPDGDIEIVEVGLRPGEKLYEELLIGNAPSPTHHPRILKAAEAFLPLEVLRTKLDRIAGLLDADNRLVLLHALQDLVPEFTSDRGVMDWVHLEAAKTDSISKVTRIA